MGIGKIFLYMFFFKKKNNGLVFGFFFKNIFILYYTTNIFFIKWGKESKYIYYPPEQQPDLDLGVMSSMTVTVEFPFRLPLAEESGDFLDFSSAAFIIC